MFPTFFFTQGMKRFCVHKISYGIFRFCKKLWLRCFFLHYSIISGFICILFFCIGIILYFSGGSGIFLRGGGVGCGVVRWVFR